MTTVLVTGGGERLTEVDAALRAAGAETVVVEQPDRLGGAIEGQTFQGYVQLPVAMTPRQGTLVSRVEQFLSEGLLSRFRAAEVVLPRLAPGAAVVLVGGQTNINLDAPDDHEARTALMRVLAHALRAERAPERLKVSTVDHTWSAEQIAAQVTAADPGSGRAPGVDEDGGRDAIGQAYADWRAEVLGLVRIEF